MLIPFEDISPASRIWIYQADKELSSTQIKLAEEFLSAYCERWQAHGAPLKASFVIKFDHFIIMAADEDFNATSGCSIDDSVRAIKEIEKLTGVSFLNRNLIPFKTASGVQLIELSKLKENYGAGMWNDTTLTFNNLIDMKSKLDNEWIIEAGKTWLKRYIPSEKIHS
jgi:hypothetical protein